MTTNILVVAFLIYLCRLLAPRPADPRKIGLEPEHIWLLEPTEKRRRLKRASV